MSALAAARTQHQNGYAALPLIESFPVKSGVTIYAGALVVIDAGYLAPGTTATGKLAVGMAEETVANAGADGAVNCKVRMGMFQWDVDQNDAVAQADVGKTVYILDDHTISKTSTGKSAAGRLLKTDGTVATVITYPFAAP